jgi:hypothetical protein
MIDDAAKLVSTCKAYQKFSHRSKAPTQPSQLIASSWPLQRWGIDIIGKLTPAQGNYTFAVVAVEYFTKCNLFHHPKMLLAKHHMSL